MDVWVEDDPPISIRFTNERTVVRARVEGGSAFCALMLFFNILDMNRSINFDRLS